MRKTYRLPQVCPHGNLGKAKCRKCRAEALKDWRQRNPERVKEVREKYEEKFPEKRAIYKRIGNNPERYPLDIECFYRLILPNEEHAGRLEHGHTDYENDGFNYVTVCHVCNHAMDKIPELMKLAKDYLRESREA